MSDPNNAALSSTERARESRRRKRERLRLLHLEVRDAEVTTLVKTGLLRAEDRDDIAAVAGGGPRTLRCCFSGAGGRRTSNLTGSTDRENSVQRRCRQCIAAAGGAVNAIMSDLCPYSPIAQ